MQYICTIHHRAFGDDGSAVATVEVTSGQVSSALELAYRLTNTIEVEWWTNEAVTLTDFGLAIVKRRRGIRSTSVGDEIVIASADERRRTERWVVASVGFKRPAEADEDLFVQLHRNTLK